MAALKPRKREDVLPTIPASWHPMGDCRCAIPRKTGRMYRGAKAEPVYEACGYCWHLIKRRVRR